MAVFIGPASEAAGTGERLVILAPAAADLVVRLGAGHLVVGTTNSVADFPEAEKVGTHMNPSQEKVAALRPTLLITTANFTPAMAERVGAEQFIYEPDSLPGIIEALLALAKRLDREEAGRLAASELEYRLSRIRPLVRPPTALYESRSNPLALAKSGSIVESLLTTAGFHYAYDGASGLVSAEWLMMHQPDYYFYQVGPMNRDPIPPGERPGWSGFQARACRVDEFEFARANTQLFALALELNQMLHSADSGTCPQEASMQVVPSGTTERSDCF